MGSSTCTTRRGGPTPSVLLVSLTFALTGCALLEDPVHSQWEGRATLPSCGAIALDQGEALEDEGRSPVACLRDGMSSGKGAELVVHFPTVEGDPITEYRRVTPDGSTEVYTDSTQDEYSDQSWSFGSCESPGSALDSAC